MVKKRSKSRAVQKSLGKIGRSAPEIAPGDPLAIDPDAEASDELVTPGDLALPTEAESFETDAESATVPSTGGDTPLQEVEFEIRHDLQKRVDLYLRDRLPAYSRAMLQKLVKAGVVMVNGRAAKSSTELRSGDVVKVTLPHVAPREAVGEEIPLEIVYEDEHFIAVNKQAGLIVHPARGHWTGTLINALLWHAEKTQGTLSVGSDPWRPGIIHRLDRDTTGLILIAKTDEAHWRLAGQFERRTIKKTYMAIVHGLVELDSDLIDAPLAVNPKVREKYAVRPDGKPAQTVYTVKERFKIGRAGYTLLELAPRTGRTHQLRVHCAHLGHPIVGDTMYGGRQIVMEDVAGKSEGGKRKGETRHAKDEANHSPLIERQALHAFRLQFVHPSLFTRMILEAPLPPDMVRLLELLRLHGEMPKAKSSKA